MVWSFFLLNLGVILLTVRLRYASEGIEYASPVPAPSWAWFPAAAAAGALAVILAAANRWRLSQAPARRAFAELMLLPALLAYEWGALPPKGWRVVDWVVITAFVAIGIACIVRERRTLAERGLTVANFASAAKMLAVPTAVMVAVPIVAACFVGTDFEWNRMGVSLAGYPFWALAQLMVFQVFLVPRLHALGASSVSTALMAGGLFALVHWPNGILMAACAPAGVVWTAVYLRRPNVPALALSMGLAAAAFANALPRESVTRNLRTGPIYVERFLEGLRPQ